MLVKETNYAGGYYTHERETLMILKLIPYYQSRLRAPFNYKGEIQVITYP